MPHWPIYISLSTRHGCDGCVFVYTVTRTGMILDRESIGASTIVSLSFEHACVYTYYLLQRGVYEQGVERHEDDIARGFELPDSCSRIPRGGDEAWREAPYSRSGCFGFRSLSECAGCELRKIYSSFSLAQKYKMCWARPRVGLFTCTRSRASPWLRV